MEDLDVDGLLDDALEESTAPPIPKIETQIPSSLTVAGVTFSAPYPESSESKKEKHKSRSRSRSRSHSKKKHSHRHHSHHHHSSKKHHKHHKSERGRSRDREDLSPESISFEAAALGLERLEPSAPDDKPAGGPPPPPDAQTLSARAEISDRTVFVHGLPLSATDDDVKKFFEANLGPVMSVKVVKDKYTRQSRGTAFVEFKDKTTVSAAIAQSGIMMGRNSLSIQPSDFVKEGFYYQPKEKNQITVVIVANLPKGVTEQDIRDIFCAFGDILELIIPRDKDTNEIRNYLYIRFGTPRDAENAVKFANGTKMGRNRIFVGLMEPGALAPGNITTSSTEMTERAIKLPPKLDPESKLTRMPKSITESKARIGLGTDTRMRLMEDLQKSLEQSESAYKRSLEIKNGLSHSTSCLLLRNLFDPKDETDPNFDIEIRDDVFSEASKFGNVLHIYVDKNSLGLVYLRFRNAEEAKNVWKSFNKRMFGGHIIEAEFLPESHYSEKFPNSVPK